MQNNWPTKKLEDVVDFSGGLWTGKKGPFKKTQVLRNTNFRSTGLLDFSNVAELEVEERQLVSRLLKKGDILLEKSGGGPDQPVGRVVYFNKDGHFSFSNFTSRLRVKNNKEVDSIYLWFFLHSLYISGITERIQKQTTGIRNLMMPEYKNLEVPIPSLTDQKKVVKKIEELFAKIAEAQKLREESKKETSNLLQSALNEVFSNTKALKTLTEVAEINPKNDTKSLSDDTEVSFIPMRYVDDMDGIVTQKDIRKLSEVRKGFTNFKDGDVIFAKITPCMENGKAALVKELSNGIGFGSTEFHVIRSNGQILPELIYYYVRRQTYRDDAEQRMTGSAGQKRVPKDFLEKSKIPVLPLPEQKKIVARLDLLSTKIRELQQFQSETEKNLKELKQAILKKAFRDEL